MTLESHARRPPLRATMIALALITALLFGAGIVYGFVHRNDEPPCGVGQTPLKQRPGMLGQTEYLCPGGRTVTK